MLNKSLLVLAVVVAATASAPAAVIFDVLDTRPGELVATTPSSTLGSVASTATVPTTTYTITGLDLTSVGGGANESIAFDVAYTFGGSGGSAVQINGYGNISVTGGNDNQVDDLETITATVSVNGATTFTGDVSLSFVAFDTGGISNPGTDEFWNIITASGTQSFQSPGNITSTFPPSSFVTLDPVAGDNNNGTFNVQGFDVQITAIPEPSAFALVGMGLLGLVPLRRRSQKEYGFTG